MLEQTLYASLSEEGQSSADEGLTCISELLYNQQSVTPRMWGFFAHIINCYVLDKGIIDEFITQSSVPLINYMVKAPVEFKNANFQGQGSPLDMILQFISKIFKDGEEADNEIH